jgi:hypothetical protein
MSLFMLKYKLVVLLRKTKTFLKNVYWWLWFHIWINEDEFHQSLSIDVDALTKIDTEKADKYILKIMRKRDRAHEMDFTEKKYNIRGKISSMIIFFIASVLFSLVSTSFAFRYLGIRDGISIVFFGSIVVSLTFFFLISRKPTSCCLKNRG